MSLDELYNDVQIQLKIDDILSYIEKYNDERLSDIKNDFDDLSSKMNNIYYHLHDADRIKNSIY